MALHGGAGGRCEMFTNASRGQYVGAKCGATSSATEQKSQRPNSDQNIGPLWGLETQGQHRNSRELANSRVALLSNFFTTGAVSVVLIVGAE